MASQETGPAQSKDRLGRVCVIKVTYLCLGAHAQARNTVVCLCVCVSVCLVFRLLQLQGVSIGF